MIRSLCRLLALAKQQRGRLAAAVVLSITGAMLAVAPAIFVARLIPMLYAAESNASDIAVIGTVVIVAIVLRFVARAGVSILGHMVAYDILYELRLRLTDRLTRTSLGDLMSLGTGRIKKVIADDVEAIELFFAHHLEEVSAGVLVPLAMLVGLFWIDWRIGSAASAALIAAFLSQIPVYRNHRATTALYHDATEELNRRTIEYVQGLPLVKNCARSVEHLDRFSRAVFGYKHFVERWAERWYLPAAFFAVGIGAPFLFMLPVVAWLYESGIIGIEQALLALLLGLSFTPSLHRLIMLPDALLRLVEGEQRISALLDIPLQPAPERPKEPQSFDVTFEDVWFSYDNRPVLRNVSFTAAGPGLTALVGASGAGKSTIARLVPRYWDADRGTVRIGGIDVRDVAPDVLSDTIAFMFQDTFLFNDTILENIRLGRPGASQEDVLRAAHDAACDAFIAALPEGYNTVVGARGVTLSGGEKQRIGLARVLLKDAPILILDEATASIDAAAESVIQRALLSLARSKTLLVIAHKPKLIAAANHIVLLRDGQVDAIGSHSALLERNDHYSSLFRAVQEADNWTFPPSHAATVAPC
jgi:ATP-binding cassette subfamily B protein